MKIIIEYDKKTSFQEYSNPLIRRPNYISIGHDCEKQKYYLTFNAKHYIITDNEVNELFKTLEKIDLSKLPESGIGVDGETYMLKISNGWNSINFEWWSDSCGEQWNGLYLLRDKIVRLKEKCVEK